MRWGRCLLFAVLLVPTTNSAGDIVTDGKLRSTAVAGAPLEVASTSMVTNLNADMVDGVDAADLYTKEEVDTLLNDIASALAPRRYYLTEATFQGDEALTACSSGFHMANVYELSSPGSLRYASDHPDAHTKPDCGTGPPAGTGGWVRTGTTGDTGVEGRANCDVWSSSSFELTGTAIMLPDWWPDPTTLGDLSQVPGGVWYAGDWNCTLSVPVWCIED